MDVDGVWTQDLSQDLQVVSGAPPSSVQGLQMEVDKLAYDGTVLGSLFNGLHPEGSLTGHSTVYASAIHSLIFSLLTDLVLYGPPPAFAWCGHGQHICFYVADRDIL